MIETKLLNKFKRSLNIDYDISIEHNLTNDQLKFIQKYTSNKTCGAIILRYRKPDSLQSLYNMIIECLSYGKGITYDKYIALYGNEIGYIKFQEYRKSKAITQEHMIELYGEVEGNSRFNEYRKKQAFSNSFEYKRDKHGWDYDRFRSFNLSRAITKENMILKYGESGIEKFNEYREKQAYAGITKEYFMATYGEKDGMRRYIECLKKKAVTHTSNIADMLFDALDCCIDNGIREYTLYSYKHDKVFAYDYVNHEKKVCIEFNGMYWHMSPLQYNKDDINITRNKTAQEIWNYDKMKRDCFMSEFHDYTYKVVWENEAIDLKHNRLNKDFISTFIENLK